MDAKELEKAIEAAKSGPKRNFRQSVDLMINFSSIDFSKPDSRLNAEVLLPKGRGKPAKTAIIAGDELVTQAKQAAPLVITKNEITSYGTDKQKMKKLADEFDFILCQTDLMSAVGKSMGQVLAPRGKMPKPIPPTAVALAPLVKRLENTVVVRNRGKFLPTVHVMIGNEEMGVQDLAANVQAVIDAIMPKLPNKEGNIRSVYLKLSMGPAIRVGAPSREEKK
ncbi:50S ribosomal protein L1 [Candidatus Micrarchaeota archaeon]|nr:50S ribosomal protein L1 [Candidatus Micrarchaeota archaeon]